MIQHFQLIGRLEQKLMIMLPMHIDQILGDLPEHPQRDWISIEADRAAPAGVQSSRQQNFPAIGTGRNIPRLLDSLHHSPTYFKNSTDSALLRARAQHLGRAA